MRPSKILLMCVSLAIVASACSSNGEESVPPEDTVPATTLAVREADASVRLLEFLGAVRERRYDDTAPLVDEPQLLLLTAIESGDAALLDGIPTGAAELPAQVRQNFWESFVSAVPGLAEDAGLDLEFSEPFTYSVDGEQFTAIQVIVGENAAAGMWVLRDDAADGWIIDPIASFGGPFVGPYTQWAQSLPAAERDAAIAAAAAYRSSWQALGDRQPADEPGVAIGMALDELFTLIDGA